MLSSDERRSRLESLLERVRQNRNKERVAVDLSVKPAMADEAPGETVIEEPLTPEPVTEEQVLEEPVVDEVVVEESVVEEQAAARPDLIPADDGVERDFFEREPAPPAEAVEEDDEIEEDLVVEEEPAPASVEEAFFDGDSQELVSPYKSEEVVEVSDAADEEEFAEIEELPENEDVAEVEELSEPDELEEVIDLSEPEVERFQAAASASGDVAVYKGEKRPREWTLAAVLDRAWKLGGKE